MTERDHLLERLEQANPVPDANRIYRDPADVRRVRSLVERKRGVSSPMGPRHANRRQGFTSGSWMAAAAAIAVIVLIGVVVQFVARSGPDGDPAAEDLIAIDRPIPDAATTTMSLSSTAASPPPTTAPPPATTPVTTTPTTTPPATTTPSSTTAPTTTLPPTTSVLASPSPPPDGVAAEIGWVLGAGPGMCAEFMPYTGPPVIERDLLAYDGGEGPFFCLLGFDPSQPVEVIVSPPAAPLRSRVLDPDMYRIDDAFAFWWQSRPDDPLGEYLLEATQGSTIVAMRFEVVAPEQSGFIIEPVRVSAGSPIDIYLYGHEPNADVTVHFYRQPGPRINFEYVASATATIDPTGWGRLRIETGAADPLGSYLIDTTPISDHQATTIPPYTAGL
ncbi:MAG: hypothetical protein OEM97_09520, partial [Acidimicrobiia bacterium]|nr:hypothetical protein [Acidimicrobiia bacterium]